LLKNGAIQRNTAQTGSLDASSEKQNAQHRETLSKKSSGNYKSAALPTELCRHFTHGNATFSSNFRRHCIRDLLWDASWHHGAWASLCLHQRCCGNYKDACTNKKIK
jgi:hypothetical protein